MGREIERTFLVHVDKVPELRGAVTVTQGYFSERPAVRVRMMETFREPDRGFITVKGRGLQVRPEWEYEIPSSEAAVMLGLVRWMVRKKRYYHTDSFNQEWEIDEFLDFHKGLWLAEIESDSVDADLTKPAWLGQEVTHDPNYTNLALAKKASRKLPGFGNRPESGPMQFGDDWPGVFLRGDDCAGYFQALKKLMTAFPKEEQDPDIFITMALLEGLAKTLQASHAFEGDKEAVQTMFAFAECHEP